jgi:hypothetical protein
LVDVRKEAKLQWLRDPSEENEANMSNVRREASKRFRNKKKECFKEKINELESNSKNKNIRGLYRGITEFKKGYKPRTNTVKDKMGDLLEGSSTCMERMEELLLSAIECTGPGGVKETDIHTICARA